MIKTTNKIILQHAPLKLSKQKPYKTHKPWITRGIQKSIKNKNGLYKKFIKSESPLIRQQKEKAYKDFKNLLLTITRQSKNSYYKEYSLDHKNNLEQIWKGIKNIIGGSHKTNGFPTIITSGAKTYKSTLDIANELNNYFGTIAEKTKTKIPPINQNFDENLLVRNENSIFLSPTDSNEIVKIIRNLKDNKSINHQLLVRYYRML